MIYNLEYLKSLMENKVEESLQLEYKAALALHPSNTKEISKDVSSFANSDGGVLIYGIKEDGEARYLPGELDPIDRKEFSKERLEQIINSNIRPRIDSLNIYPIPISDHKAVYVVRIGKSDTAHQAEDKRYYKRYNFQSVAMEDYEIRDILNRQKHPKLELTFELAGQTLIMYLQNVGSVLAHYVSVKIRMPSKVAIDKTKTSKRNGNRVEFFETNTVREMVNPYAPVAQYWPSRYDPILPEMRFKLKGEISLNDYEDQDLIEWEIFCDNASPVIGSRRLVEIISSTLS